MREAMDMPSTSTSTGDTDAQTNQTDGSKIATTASQAESKFRVEMGSGVAGTIRADNTTSSALPTREHEVASTH